MTIHLTWPPPFTVRKSAKAKRASLRVSVYGKIEVVVPEKVIFFNPEALINEHQSWILQQLSQSLPPPEPACCPLPQELTFPGFQCVYSVEYIDKEGSNLSLRQADSRLTLSGNLNDLEKIRLKLMRWLNQEAAKLLLPHLVHLSDLHDLPFQTLRVRSMKSRWGSCSSKGNITLNAHLVFLPLHLIYHVILHELCHTRYMSHGPRFWSLLSELDPQTGSNNQALGKAQQFLPRVFSGGSF